jgi:hypothetical protein
VAAGLLLIIAGLWLVLQAVAGGLAARLVNLAGGSSGEESSGSGHNQITVPSPTNNDGTASGWVKVNGKWVHWGGKVAY